MQNKNEAKEIGLRCRRQRQAKGMTQEELAHRLNVSTVTVSKYENEGVSNIETIRNISDVLGKDLLIEERDIENPIGEIGKEILLLLLNNKGYIEFDEMIREYMYGLNWDTVSDVVAKLDLSGLCVREQYIDVMGDECDTLFITAKGIITLKHNIPEMLAGKDFDEQVKRCKTYEIACKEYSDIFEKTCNFVKEHSTYEKYQEARPIAELLRRMVLIPGFRDDFVIFLAMKGQLLPEIDSELYTHTNCFCDIIYRMVNRLDIETLRFFAPHSEDRNRNERECEDEYCEIQHLESIIDGGFHSYSFERAKGVFEKLYLQSKQEMMEDIDSINKIDISKLNADDIAKKAEELLNSEFCRRITICENDSSSVKEAKKELAKIYGISEEVLSTLSQEEMIEIFSNCMREWAANDLYNAIGCITENIEAIIESTGTDNPLKWFSDEEIKIFINDNLIAPGTQEEMKLNILLNDVLQKGIGREYYCFPLEWEENGIADLVRSKYDIPKYEI